MPMQHLTVLLEHGISMMAEGATLKQQGQAHGDEMLVQSADLLRRTMSGPEMTAMHQGGHGHSPAMQHTHNLGAAAFDLLDLMMSLPAEKFPTHALELHHGLTMAAQGASLKSLAYMGMEEDMDKAMQEHGEKMQQAAEDLSKKASPAGVYQQGVFKVIRLLAGDVESHVQHMD